MKHPLFTIAILLLPLTHLPAGQLAVGDILPAITANDQHGTPFVLTTNIQVLLVATEMDCAKAANRKLADQRAGFLEKYHAAYLMDIHTMPAIGRFFAIPKMQKYPQRIVLIDSPTVLADFPTKASCVTVISLNATNQIQKISYWNPASEPVAQCFP